MAVVTRTLKSSGGDYSLMSTWESSEQTNLVSAGDSHVLECDAFTCSDSVTIGGWTTGASNTITVKAAAGHEHGGVVDAGFMLTSASRPLAVEVDYVIVIGIQITQTASSSNGPLYISVSGSGVLIDQCIIKGNVNNTSYGVFVSTGDHVIRNSLIIGSRYGAYYANFTSPTVSNCSFVAFKDNGGFRASGSPVLKNCVAYTSSGTFTYGFGAGFSASSTNNATQDSSAPGSSPVTSITSAAFNNYAGGDYSPASGGVLVDAGTDLSGSFTTDITGATRSGTWDIGAYELVAAGGGFKAAWAKGSNQIIGVNL